jgi:hypothetical protein
MFIKIFPLNAHVIKYLTPNTSPLCTQCEMDVSPVGAPHGLHKICKSPSRNVHGSCERDERLAHIVLLRVIPYLDLCLDIYSKYTWSSWVNPIPRSMT